MPGSRVRRPRRSGTRSVHPGESVRDGGGAAESLPCTCLRPGVTAPCIEEGCDAPKALPKHRCRECVENMLPMVEQVELARQRKDAAPTPHRSRIPERDWPQGRRFCAGCQSFRRLGLDVAPSASKCRPCASAASHASRTKAAFGLTPEDYATLLARQGGVCAICVQRPVSKRLAVDHDHNTGEIRGLLCSRCNWELLPALHHSMEIALRAVSYLGMPPGQGRATPPTSHSHVQGTSAPSGR